VSYKLIFILTLVIKKSLFLMNITTRIMNFKVILTLNLVLYWTVLKYKTKVGL
jgi:hypothetical protein